VSIARYSSLVPKLRVGILFGGRSTEHEVSITSATTILHALDPARYEPVLIGVDHDGRWLAANAPTGLLPEAVFSSAAAVEVTPALDAGLGLSERLGSARVAEIDVLFPIIHGRFGEDGTLQGLLELASVPYVGSGVLASALAMDKVATKRILRDADVPVVPCLDASRREVLRDPGPFIDRVEARFEYPLFAKPVNTGSSVGVTKARDRAELASGLADAARYDLRVLVEPGLDAREVECAVLGGHDPEASVPGEIRTRHDFYDYEAKYVSEETELVLPAPIDESTSERLRELAVRAFRVLGCWGLARVDFFLERASGELLLNELNTLPGMTEGSLYWRAWEASGLALPELVDRLIELALERHRERTELEIRYRR
jgi:D-alanine-D-alanine ligase